MEGVRGRGAMMPSDASRLEGIKGIKENNDLKRDVCCFCAGCGAGMVGNCGWEGVCTAGAGEAWPAVGSARSPALRLKNKKSGTSHTHTPKNVAISANPGACTPAEPLCRVCLASWLTLANQKNHRK